MSNTRYWNISALLEELSDHFGITANAKTLKQAREELEEYRNEIFANLVDKTQERDELTADVKNLQNELEDIDEEVEKLENLEKELLS